MPLRMRYAFVLGFVGFVTSFGAHIIAVNLPVYADQVGIGTAIIGILIASYDFAEIISKPLFGAVADKSGMKKTLLVGIAIFIFASGLYLFVNPRLLLLVRFLQGLGAAGLSAVSLALIGTYYPERRGAAYGIYNAIKGAGYVISPVLGGVIVVTHDFSALFVATAGVGAFALLLSLMLPVAQGHQVREPAPDDDEFSFKSLAGTFSDPTLSKLYAVIVINMFFVSILFGFLPVYVHSLGYSPLYSGVVLSVVALSYLLIQPLAGRWADAKDAMTTIRVGLLLSAITVALIPFLAGSGLFIACIASGAGVGIVWTNSDAVVSRLAKQGRLGATMGAAGSFKELGDMVGPILIGALSQALGLRFGFVTCGLAGILLLVVFRKNKANVA